MKAVVAGENRRSLAVRDVPVPKPDPHDLLVKTFAIGLNRAERNCITVDRVLDHSYVDWAVQQLGPARKAD